jgi:peptide/nickel transport system substrate-binding protein
MDVVDPTTLRITLKARNGVFPQVVAQLPFVASPTALQTLGDKFSDAPVGAGPFKMKSWTRDSQMVLVRNPAYWNAPLPYLDQVTMKFIGDETSRINTFKVGDLDAMYSNLPQTRSTMLSAGAIENTWVGNAGTGMYMNVRKAPFNDLRVRQAVVMAIDRADMDKVISDNQLPPMDTIFRTTSPFYDPTAAQLPYDPVKAQQLFDAYTADTGGPVTFDIQAFNTGVYPAASQYVQAKLNAFRNVKVSVTVQASATQQQREINGDFLATMSSVFWEDPEPTWSSQFSCSIPTYTGWCDSQFDALMADQRQTLDANQRITDIKAATKIFVTQVPIFFFQQRVAWLWAQPKLQNVAIADDGMLMWDRVWIKTR